MDAMDGGCTARLDNPKTLRFPSALMDRRRGFPGEDKAMARKKSSEVSNDKAVLPPAGDVPASPIPPSDEGRPGPESDQRLPENSEQAVTASEPTDNSGADDDASNAAPPTATSSEQESAPLFAVERVNLAGKYYEPGAQLEESQIAKDEAAIPVLLAAGAIREG